MPSSTSAMVITTRRDPHCFDPFSPEHPVVGRPWMGRLQRARWSRRGARLRYRPREDYHDGLANPRDPVGPPSDTDRMRGSAQTLPLLDAEYDRLGPPLVPGDDGWLTLPSLVDHGRQLRLGVASLDFLHRTSRDHSSWQSMECRAEQRARGERSAPQATSWKMIPAVCQRPERASPAPRRIITRKAPLNPR